MESFEEVYTSDEDEDISKVLEELTIADSSTSNAEESFIKPYPKKVKKNAIMSESEDENDDGDDDDGEEEEEEFERRALSPRTRMSITGVRPADLSDSSEIYDSDEEEEEESRQSYNDKDDSMASVKENSFVRDVEEKNSFHEDDASQSSEQLTSDFSSGEEDESQKSNHRKDKSVAKKNSFKEKSYKAGRSVSKQLTSDSDSDTPTKSNDRRSTAADTKSRPSFAKYSSVFGRDLEDKFSSTMMVPEIDESLAEDKFSSTMMIPEIDESRAADTSVAGFAKVVEESRVADDSIENSNNNKSSRKSAAGESEVTIDSTSPTLNASKAASSNGSKASHESDLVEVHKSVDIVDISSDDSDAPTISDVKPVKPENIKSIQTKISAALSRPGQSINRVSKEFYDKEVKKLDELKGELANAENLLEKLGPSLFDGGKQLSIRVASLQNTVRKKAQEVVNLQVEEDDVVIVDDVKKPIPKTEADVPNWDELSAAVNAIKPVHTGKIGLNTFNTQKVLTIERLKDIHGSLETRPGDDVLADDPKGLKVSLMPHQKHALAWMDWREQQKPRGGILADDMGLGKTLSMISLVLDVKNREENNENDSDSDSSDDEVRNNVWTTKNRRDYHNGGTLIVCPASLIRQWESEVANRVHRHKLSVSVHHGQNRDTKPRHLATYDIVVTTYQLVLSESKNHGALFSIAWKRVILDEAHMVRNHKSLSSIACCQLRAKCRWALTGTPIQNKEIDLYALLKFLKCSPFDDLNHWKKWIDNKSAGGQQRLNTLMKSLMLRRTKLQLQQQGGLECLPERDACKIIEVILEKDEMNVYQKIMAYSQSLFAQFLHQRAEKNSDAFINDGPSRPTFMKAAKDPTGAYFKMHQKFSKLHKGQRDVKSHEILVLLLRLRQICCHPGLIDAMLEDEDETATNDSCASEPDIDLLDQLNKLAINNNGIPSLDESVNEENKAISRASAKVLQRSNPVFNLARPSSKMKSVLQIVDKLITSTSDKAIIVSQWSSTLNILKTHLAAKNIATLTLDGKILVKNRQAIVNEFNDPNTRPRILLLSLTAGGVGLNLIGANHLLLIDMHWNPQLESQAQDRIYRVGQKKTVHIYKFMCKDTVEERIKALQDHKLAIANGVLTGAKAVAGSKLSIDDLRGLFGL